MTIETKFDLNERVIIADTGESVKVLEIESVRADGISYELYRVSNKTWEDQYLEHQLVKHEDDVKDTNG